MKHLRSLKLPFVLLWALLVGVLQAQSTPTDYKLRAGDQVHVFVIGEKDLSQDVSVLEDGTASYPYAGQFRAEGMTLQSFRSKVTDALSKVIRNPEVTVSLTRSRPRLASGVGVFFKPATVEFQPGQTLLDLIAKCEGLVVATRPEWVHAQLIRKQQVLPIDYLRLVNGDATQNRELEDGDVFLVNETDIDRKSVKVLGEVGHPGAFPVASTVTFSSILAQAGGATPHASLRSAVITRGIVTVPVDLSRLVLEGREPSGVRLLPGDTLLIPANVAHFLVVGAVKQPGLFDVPETQRITLMDALARSGGFDPEADLRWVYILRKASFADPAKANVVQTPEKIDMRASVLRGRIASMELHEGDVVYVPFRKTPVGFKDVTGIIGAAILQFIP